MKLSLAVGNFDVTAVSGMTDLVRNAQFLGKEQHGWPRLRGRLGLLPLLYVADVNQTRFSGVKIYISCPLKSKPSVCLVRQLSGTR